MKDKIACAQFYIEAFGYKIQTQFDLVFDDGTKAQCLALEPPEKLWDAQPINVNYKLLNPENVEFNNNEFHLAPEIFISDGEPESIVGKWVAEREKNGGNFIHHLAYQVDDVRAIMMKWKSKGFGQFMTEEPVTCPGLTQVFTKPNIHTGVIYEFINRGKFGFCAENVKKLMISSEEAEK